METNVINTLWTGGWDSTYRMVELSRMDVTVQPIYVEDPGRRSTAREKQAMEEILAALKARPETRASFLPTRFIPLAQIPKDPEITAAYKRIAKSAALGTQYDWLARLAVEYPGLELGIEKASYDKQVGCRATILKNGGFATENGVAVLDKAKATEDCRLLMGNFRFPIIHLTEEDMRENIRQWGCEDVMALIWFCHDPIDGRPCGMCRPCEQKMDGGMTFLLPPNAQRRYKFFKATKKCFGEYVAVKMAWIVYRRYL